MLLAGYSLTGFHYKNSVHIAPLYWNELTIFCCCRLQTNDNVLLLCSRAPSCWQCLASNFFQWMYRIFHGEFCKISVGAEICKGWYLYRYINCHRIYIQEFRSELVLLAKNLDKIPFAFILLLPSSYMILPHNIFTGISTRTFPTRKQRWQRSLCVYPVLSRPKVCQLPMTLISQHCKLRHLR